MKWFRQFTGNQAGLRADASAKAELAIGSRPSFDAGPGMHFHIYNAIGGRIVSCDIYDSKVEQTRRRIYIIPDDQDFDQELTKIISIESLR